MLPPILDWSNYLQQTFEELYRSFALFTSPSSFTYRSLLQRVLHSGRKKFLPVRDAHSPNGNGNKPWLFKTYMYGINSPLDIRTDSSDGVVVAIEVHCNGQAFAKHDWGCASITSFSLISFSISIRATSHECLSHTLVFFPYGGLTRTK